MIYIRGGWVKDDETCLYIFFFACTSESKIKNKEEGVRQYDLHFSNIALASVWWMDLGKKKQSSKLLQ